MTDTNKLKPAYVIWHLRDRAIVDDAVYDSLKEAQDQLETDLSAESLDLGDVVICELKPVCRAVDRRIIVEWEILK